MYDTEYHGPEGVDEFVSELLNVEVELILLEVERPGVWDKENHSRLQMLGAGLATLRNPVNRHLVMASPLALRYLAFNVGG